MEPSSNHQGSQSVGAISGPLSDVVTQLRMELHNLRTNEKELRRRIHSINQVLRGLQDMTANPAVESAPTNPQPQAVVPDRVEPSLPAGARRLSNQMMASLQRACRIALLEAPGALSLEEVYARIVRRGSFPFANLEQASPSLIEVLGDMARDREIRCLESDACCHWERIATIDECPPTQTPNSLFLDPGARANAANATLTAR